MGTPTVGVAGAVAIAVLLLFSAFFSSSETAIFSLSPEWIDRQRTTGHRGHTLAELRDDPHRLLVTLLVGNNVVNVAISSIATVVVVTYLPPGTAVVVTTLFTSLVVLVFGEIVPKSFGLGNAERWSLTVAPAIRLVERALYPVIVVLNHLTRRLSDRLSAESAIERPYLD